MAATFHDRLLAALVAAATPPPTLYDDTVAIITAVPGAVIRQPEVDAAGKTNSAPALVLAGKTIDIVAKSSDEMYLIDPMGAMSASCPHYARVIRSKDALEVRRSCQVLMDVVGSDGVTSQMYDESSESFAADALEEAVSAALLFVLGLEG